MLQCEPFYLIAAKVKCDLYEEVETNRIMCKKIVNIEHSMMTNKKINDFTKKIVMNSVNAQNEGGSFTYEDTLRPCLLAILKLLVNTVTFDSSLKQTKNV